MQLPFNWTIIVTRIFFTRYRIEEEDEEEFNQGCYYFMACLDSFWIL